MTDDEKIMDYDPDEGGFGYDLRLLEDKLVMGRKEHKCCHCCGPIQTGERQRVQKGVIDGEVMTCRWCPECCQAMIKDYDEEDCEHMEARIRLHDSKVEGDNDSRL